MSKKNWSKPCGRYRGPLPRGKAVQATSLRHLAAFALSRRAIRYSGVEKHAAFGPKWWPTISSRGVWPSGRPDSKGERGLRAPGEGCVLLRATATSKAAAAKCRPRRHQSHSVIGCKHRRHDRRLRSHRWLSPADGWLKALDFTGQGAGRHSNGVIFSSPIETRQAPTSIHQPMERVLEPERADPFKKGG
jgi:hypothetical protein